MEEGENREKVGRKISETNGSANGVNKREKEDVCSCFYQKGGFFFSRSIQSRRDGEKKGERKTEGEGQESIGR